MKYTISASYLVPVIDANGDRWVTEAELSRGEDAIHTGTTGSDIAATGPPDELLTLGEAARLTGVTRHYLGRLTRRYESDKAHIDATLAAGRSPRGAPRRRARHPRPVVRHPGRARRVPRSPPPARRAGRL